LVVVSAIVVLSEDLHPLGAAGGQDVAVEPGLGPTRQLPEPPGPVVGPVQRDLELALVPAGLPGRVEDEQLVELDSDEEKEMRNKYSRRTLESNEHRYEEKKSDNENEGGEEGEEEEPEVDLSSFLERQRLDDSTPPTLSPPDGADPEDDIDHTLISRTSRYTTAAPNKKGQIQQIEWDKEMEDLQREKASAEAARDLKARFRGEKPNTSRYAKGVILADPELQKNKPPSGSKEEMEDFLDDLLD